ncbi:hypothetical protein GCM10007047_02730 [Cerasicoccus arenae]|uniref:Uncharacterized protein n=1 Tax=Cerasicoccus arenae TaxID=424488 RepID=A0A8J3DF22_9BACT|nr:hypothetical protein GCM10007047_02730 [Cerasicoccus arenae]
MKLKLVNLVIHAKHTLSGAKVIFLQRLDRQTYDVYALLAHEDELSPDIFEFAFVKMMHLGMSLESLNYL